MRAGSGPAVDVPAFAEKVMSTTLREFHRSLRRLAEGIDIQDGQSHFRVPAGGADVEISLEPAPEALLGTRLRLERYRVRLDMSALPTAQRSVFLERFDRVFQRGGG